MKKSEALYSHDYMSRKVRRWMKKLVHRARRREERRDPENAPTKRKAYIQGWSL